jgi:acyl carrier protein
MTDDELKDNIFSVLSLVISNDNLSNKEDIMNLGMGDFSEWDSFGHLRIVMELESSLDIKFNSEEIFDIRTISDIIKSVKDKI